MIYTILLCNGAGFAGLLAYLATLGCKTVTIGTRMQCVWLHLYDRLHKDPVAETVAGKSSTAYASQAHGTGRNASQPVHLGGDAILYLRQPTPRYCGSAPSLWQVINSHMRPTNKIVVRVEYVVHTVVYTIRVT
jgi:hypothetical protein